MIEHPVFAAEPWRVIETSLNLDQLAQTESVFALSNGHIGLRGNLDEGEPHGLPGTYLANFYELRPLPAAESAYGQSESSQTVVNVTNGKLVRVLVDDEPFDVRYGRLLSHRRTLDLREGTLRREAQWESPGRRTVTVRSCRLVSFTQRAVAAILYEVVAGDRPVRLVMQSDLVANEELPVQRHPSRSGTELVDPRAAAALVDPLVGERHTAEGRRVTLVHRTRVSGLRMAAVMDHQLLEAPGDRELRLEHSADHGRVSVILTLRPGERVRFAKYLAYGWSAERSLPALDAQVAAAVDAAMHTGFDGLLDEQRRYLDRFWERADVEVEGDDEIQQAVRFALFHLLQAGARTETRAIAAKGLTGPGYDGHAFWDTETFVLPVLTATAPAAAADALRWRHRTLPLARDRAHQLGFRGAAFPWRTIHGEECSGYWPASTAAFHVNADIADAVVRYLDATADGTFDREVAVDLLVHTARLWQSLGHHDDGRGFRIDGVTGPDEYSAIADNNVYTNLMARRNLRAAIEAAGRHPDAVARLGVDDAEVRAWQAAADAMYLPWDEDLGVHPQADGFTRHERWDFSRLTDDDYPLMLHFPYFDLYRKQVCKQADLVMALATCPDEFTEEQMAADFAYYEALTVRDSSLSAAIQSVVAARVGHLDLAYDYLGEAALMDLDDLEHNTRDGLHMASLAGSWLALVAGFAGMRLSSGRLSFAPRLPPRIGRLRFRVTHLGAVLRVDVAGGRATYESLRLDGASTDPLELWHHDERLEVPAGTSVTRDLRPVEAGEPPIQPPGRRPAPRGG